MIRINQIKLTPEESKNPEVLLKEKICKILRIKPDEIHSFQIVRRSIDARKKDLIQVIYACDIESPKEGSLRNNKKLSKNVSFFNKVTYQPKVTGRKELRHRPVIVGFGPAGIFSALMLARAGFCPVVYERGASIEERSKKISDFWENGNFYPDGNAQFGEGGAGTFSDGKLNSSIHDKIGRTSFVLQTFVEHGADPQILYDAKPHIGTDILKKVIVSIRKEIQALGGQVHFHSQVMDFSFENQKIKKIKVNDTWIPVEVCILAIGHSARDTFHCLYEKQVAMEAKPFAVGVRIQHPQKMINQDQYGEKYRDFFGAAPYKLTYTAKDKRGVYSFCMCPGGYVVNASSEENKLCINGMSNHNRESENANSALVVTVRPEDFKENTLFAGMHFQEELEEKAYLAGHGKIPVQLYGDFKEKKPSVSYGNIHPVFLGLYEFADVRGIFPEFIGDDLEEAIEYFEGKLPGYASKDAILAGVESRTSSPIRILRDEGLSSLGNQGLYPCGEGAGYAGGITSAAVDGLKVYEAIIKDYQAGSLMKK